jgi:hypothetical protein
MSTNILINLTKIKGSFLSLYECDRNIFLPFIQLRATMLLAAHRIVDTARSCDPTALFFLSVALVFQNPTLVCYDRHKLSFVLFSNPLVVNQS